MGQAKCQTIFEDASVVSRILCQKS